jgi:hypothetical protein
MMPDLTVSYKLDLKEFPMPGEKNGNMLAHVPGDARC